MTTHIENIRAALAESGISIEEAEAAAFDRWMAHANHSPEAVSEMRAAVRAEIDAVLDGSAERAWDASTEA